MSRYLVVVVVGMLLLIVVPSSSAHCDSLGGPVILDAQSALKSGDLTPTLKWIKKDDEPELRSVFAKVIALRDKGPDVREIAQQYFFETLVRLHRANEGAPYTGLKSEAVAHDPVIARADTALASGDSKDLVHATMTHVQRQLLAKYERAAVAKRKADTSVEAGREYVRAYVDFMHYVEKLQAKVGAESLNPVNVHEHD